MENIITVKKPKEPNYKEAYNILMCYWDSLPDEDKPKIDRKLKNIGL